jgi:hypothetical protein
LAISRRRWVVERGLLEVVEGAGKGAPVGSRRVEIVVPVDVVLGIEKGVGGGADVSLTQVVAVIADWL